MVKRVVRFSRTALMSFVLALFVCTFSFSYGNVCIDSYTLSLAQQGNATAAYEVGYKCYEAAQDAGEYSPQYREYCNQALEWFEQAIALKFPLANRAMAGLYTAGDCVPANPQKALEYYRAAAQQNDPESLYYLAQNDRTLDEEIKLSYVEKAAEGGHARAILDYVKRLVAENFCWGEGELPEKWLAVALGFAARNSVYKSCGNPKNCAAAAVFELLKHSAKTWPESNVYAARLIQENICTWEMSPTERAKAVSGYCEKAKQVGHRSPYYNICD